MRKMTGLVNKCNLTKALENRKGGGGVGVKGGHPALNQQSHLWGGNNSDHPC